MDPFYIYAFMESIFILKLCQVIVYQISKVGFIQENLGWLMKSEWFDE